MSSHHIVREKQEPALLIENLDGFDQEYFGQLLEWSPTILVAADSYDTLTSLGIKTDIVVQQNSFRNNYSEEHLKELNGENIVETALKYLIKENYGAVNIISKKFLAKDYYFYLDKINMVIYSGCYKIYAIKSGYSKWKIAGESIFLLDPGADLPVIAGLEICGEQTEKEGLTGNFHCYKTIKDGFFSLFFKQQFLFIAEKLM